MVVLAVNAAEKELIRELDRLGHGDLLDIEHQGTTYAEDRVQVHESVYDMILALRQRTRFDRLVITDGLPRFAEIHGEMQSGRRYVQKLKFS